ncbi:MULTISPECIES: Dam family site-specific DNA-(adenine-N6)-methyltransferase [Aeromonas]|nr:Dam family site-specific DNA-(adenine-N6)-methyltransferase [Aeromonas jandaei]
MATQKSFLKWVGSKARLIPDLMQVLPRSGAVLREPFAGSATIFMNTDYETYHLNDANIDLVNTFRFLASDCDAFTNELRSLFIGGNCVATYQQRVKQFNDACDSREKALLFNYLVRHSFNGLFRVNQKGFFNAPFGNYAKVCFPEREMAFFAEKVTRAKAVYFTANDYQDFLKLHISQADEGDVLYLDPPYVPSSQTADFCSYTGSGFDGFHQRVLHQYALMFVAAGNQVVLSNSDTAMTRKLYSGQDIHVVDVRRSISCNGSRRDKVRELIVNYEQRHVID